MAGDVGEGFEFLQPSKAIRLRLAEPIESQGGIPVLAANSAEYKICEFPNENAHLVEVCNPDCVMQYSVGPIVIAVWSTNNADDGQILRISTSNCIDE